MQASTLPARATGVSQRAGAGQVNCMRNHYLKTPQSQGMHLCVYDKYAKRIML